MQYKISHKTKVLCIFNHRFLEGSQKIKAVTIHLLFPLLHKRHSFQFSSYLSEGLAKNCHEIEQKNKILFQIFLVRLTSVPNSKLCHLCYVQECLAFWEVLLNSAALWSQENFVLSRRASDIYNSTTRDSVVLKTEEWVYTDNLKPSKLFKHHKFLTKIKHLFASGLLNGKDIQCK